MQPILRIEHLRKQYGSVVAVEDVSFSIAEGICFGLLGPNGAGKTTTIEMIEGIIEPSAGTILYRGAPRARNFLQEIGIQFQATALMDFMTVRETLQLFSQFYDQTEPLEELVRQCDLGDFLDRYANKLSGGQQQRLLLALAVLNRPQLVFLDEPTTGLDPQARRNFWQLIKSIKKRGATIILTTHYMDEAEQLCDELAIMDRGRIIASGSPQQLLREHFGYLYVCLDRADCEPVLHHFTDTEMHGDRVFIRTQSAEKTLQALMAQGVSLHSLSVRNPTLEDLFLKLTGHHLRE
ncbi:MAG TPA: ABC transporter ATP-binding protein [Pseudomonadales bacterium]|nr:ABC transporter ATP-binding protein [Pseudomonadales bacterium]